MQDADIYLKTEAGRDEIKSRSRGLSMATRAILLMVDGQRNVSALRTIIAGSKAPGETLEMLLAQGLIEARTASTTTPPATSISTPRVATMGRATGESGASGASTVSPAPSAPMPAYDGPLDLTLPSIGSPASIVGTAREAGSDASTSASRYEHLYTMMNEIVRDFLPAHRRYFIQLKIERCGTAGELVELLDTVQVALAKARGDAFANEVISRVRNAAG